MDEPALLHRRVQDLRAEAAELARTKAEVEEKITTLLTQQRDLETTVVKIEHEIEDAAVEVEREIEALRREKLLEMETSVAAQKEIALSRIMAWSEEEKSRLQTRLDKEYKTQAAELRRQLLERVSTEFDAIHAYFAAFANERQVMAENDIRDFLAERRAMIVSGLK